MLVLRFNLLKPPNDPSLAQLFRLSGSLVTLQFCRFVTGFNQIKAQFFLPALVASKIAAAWALTSGELGCFNCSLHEND